MNTHVKVLLKSLVVFILVILFFYTLIINPIFVFVFLCAMALLAVFLGIFSIMTVIEGTKTVKSKGETK